SWVGVRGAVPIIFATYERMSPDGVHARFMFNLVFFITILSLLIQGTTVNTMAHWLGLTKELPTHHFHMELPDDVTAALDEMTITKEHLTDGTRLREMHLPPHTLAILVKRNDEYIVPRGDTRLHIDDVLLLISRDGENQPTSQPSVPTP
ncbi:MAG: potassium/proton antiporter, partial [Bacteroidaceae bacterium]|nr:potassium/proton antiporter [Bacteroidaceae bacterium]